MSEQRVYPYLPDYAVSPGEVLDEYLESLKMTQLELAKRTGLTQKTINEIVKGKAPITPETAMKFERVLGRPAHFWNNLERQYQEDTLRIAEMQRLKSHLAWLKTLPLRDMIKLKWIQEVDDKTLQLEEVLRFFGIASPERWANVWSGHQVAYRQSKRLETNAMSVSAWLRRGELVAQGITCAPFSTSKFRAILMELRALTTESPHAFQKKLISLCSSAGVAVVFVPELPKTGVFGATRWIGDKAVIQLSLRYKSNDHLWFTFFHEAGHILLHGKKAVFLEGGECDEEKEKEANSFAENLLIPRHVYAGFVEEGQFTMKAISTLAAQANIAPGIVVGRLQHDGHIKYNFGNELKVFYSWGDC